MNKIKVIFLTILSFVVVGLLAESMTYYVQSNRLIKEGYKFIDSNKPPYPTNIEIFSNHYEKMNKNSIFENKAGTFIKRKPSIFIFGDVYANSIDLELKDNLTSKLSRYLHRTVYNFASAGWGIQHMYFILKNEEYLNTIKAPDTIMYIYVDDQKNRLNSFAFYPHHNFLYLKYKLEDNKLVEEVPQFLYAYNSYFIRAIERFNGFRKSNSKNPNIQLENFNLMKSLFEESRRIAKIKYPNLKNFIIIRYVWDKDSIENLKRNENSAIAQLEYNMWDKLRHEGFTIIDISSLNGNEYNDSIYRNSDSSPNAETLDEIIPLIVEEAGIY